MKGQCMVCPEKETCPIREDDRVPDPEDCCFGFMDSIQCGRCNVEDVCDIETRGEWAVGILEERDPNRLMCFGQGEQGSHGDWQKCEICKFRFTPHLGGNGERLATAVIIREESDAL